MASPFLLQRPSASACHSACDALVALHGRPGRHIPRVGCEIQEPHSVLDSLVRTILSQNTTDITSARAFTSLKKSFPDWELVRTAPPGAVEDAIRVGGLADIKAARIKTILNSLLEETGSLSLEHLRQLPCEDIKQQLSRYKGVGPKTVACVLMFCLGRAEFPVDTHVWEISKQLGWVPPGASREHTYEHLNSKVPDEIKYDLHVLMVQHGKQCPACGKRGAPQKRKLTGDAQPCPLAQFKRRQGSNSGNGSSGGIDSKRVATVAVKVEECCSGQKGKSVMPAVAARGAPGIKVERDHKLPDFALAAVKREQLSPQKAPVEGTVAASRRVLRSRRGD